MIWLALAPVCCHSIQMRQRLDQALVTRGLIATRSRASDAIARGLVRVGAGIASKASQQVLPGDALDVDDAQAGTAYVSRGALKLLAGLKEWGFEAKDRICLDIGASTGGFSQVLLEAGADKVYAVDVGHSQLHETLRHNPHLVCLESQDSRTLDGDIIPDPIAAIVADVSFISLEKALPAALALAEPGAWLVALIKPQFEAQRPDQVGRGGIVRDATVRDAAVARVVAWIGALPGWRVTGTMPSPIAGGSVNGPPRQTTSSPRY